jgi:hypothetical protein
VDHLQAALSVPDAVCRTDAPRVRPTTRRTARSVCRTRNCRSPCSAPIAPSVRPLRVVVTTSPTNRSFMAPSKVPITLHPDGDSSKLLRPVRRTTKHSTFIGQTRQLERRSQTKHFTVNFTASGRPKITLSPRRGRLHHLCLPTPEQNAELFRTILKFHGYVERNHCGLCMCMCVSVCVFICVWSMYVYLYVCMVFMHVSWMYGCVYACVDVCM